ncbi:LOW QUALITY PROTEIN: hypothetical protein PHMEG_00018790 [Phytophthora megakarya]|uniref:Uncharacterized protein n=1 Tax=Phytophthora megakarya TaxID=4795 RepID=A0A225VSX3_9STRA|nr:LOW QUALITY PROTEIN: hypothetical protein PHMEG_00018790 [Phytophthora megakarya]
MTQAGSDPGIYRKPPVAALHDLAPSHSHTTDRDRRLATLESELRQSNLTRDRLVRDRDHLDLQVHQLRSYIRDMEAFQHGQRDEITRLETEISTLTDNIGDFPENLHTQVLQPRAERNDFERQTISAREDLHNAETDRDRLRLEVIQAGDEIRDLQEQVRGLELETDDARSESATGLASYNRIFSSLTRTQPDHGRDPSLGSPTRLAQPHRDRALADLALARATLTQVTFDRDRAFNQLAQTTEDRDRALVDRDSALRLRDQAVAERDQVRLDLFTETASTVQLDDDLEVVRLELQERESHMMDLQVAHDQLAELRDLAESDLNEADVLLTHLASRIRESQEARMPKRERSPLSSPPQLPPSKTPRSDRPISPSPNQDQSEIEDQEHQDQAEVEGPEDQELEDKPEIPSGGGGSPGDPDSPSPDHGPTTPPPSPPRSPGGSPGGGSPEGGSPIQLHPPLFPAEARIPHYSALKRFTAAETHPWDPAIVGTVPIIAMIQATLTNWMPIPPNFLFPFRNPLIRAPIPMTGYCSELITGANVLALMATESWRILGQRRPTPLTFDHNLHRRAETPLWRIAVSYAALDEDHMIAYWESTHYLEITSVMTDADSDLFTYHQDRRH